MSDERGREAVAGGLWACTIVSKNYLPFARVLARSFHQHHPLGRFFVLLVDRVEDRFDPADEPFELLLAEDLGIERFVEFAFKYTILELNTAVKPALLQRLFELGAHKLVYFDPDILIADRLDELAAALDRSQVVLTPHLLAPIDDDLHPGELHILQAGAYNLGFIALARGESSDRLLDWWHQRVYERCVVDIPKGLFVDQKWVDLVPGLFEGVEVLREPGYNVAYWNLNGRTVEGDAAGGYRVNGRPLRFFHFSGIDPTRLDAVSKHQNRFTLQQLGPAARELYQRYARLLLEAGHAGTRGWPYVYGRFDNGVRIPDPARALYRSLGTRRARFGDPFATGEGSFYQWMNQPARDGAGMVTRLVHSVYLARPDLVESHPDLFGRDAPRFQGWLLGGGAEELGFDAALLAPPVPAAAPGEAAPEPVRPGWQARARGAARRVYHSRAARGLKRQLRRALGEERTDALRGRMRTRRGIDAAPPGPLTERLAELVISRPGLNVCGYLTAESGMGEGVRGLVRALESAGISHALSNLELGVASRTADRSFSRFASTWEHDLNLFFVNADQVPHVAALLGEERWRRRYNIGYWLWELAELPRVYWPAFDYFHEIWTASSFCAEALAAVSPVPVRRVPLPVAFPEPTAVEVAAMRQRLGLAEARFAFLFVFDYLSYAQRKNPEGLLHAFRRAFPSGAGADGVELLVKTINGERNPEAVARLEELARGLPVRFVGEYFTKHEVHTLMSACDAYVSLHRSEGFGLTLAEAMYLGRPVIATEYAGSVDFAHAGTAFPVPYELVAIDDEAGPYPRGSLWAEPDIDAAAALLREVVEDRRTAAAVGERGRREIRGQYSHEAVGRRVAELIARIEQRVAAAR